MITIFDVKNYLRIDADYDDIQIKSLMLAAKGYMKGAIDKYDEVYADADASWQAMADLAQKRMIADWYENRLPVGKVTSAVDLLMVQLQLHGKEAEGE